MKLLVLSIIISLFSFSNLFTKNFDTTVTINGQERMISYIAPNLLNYTNPYDLIICLHDSTETAIEYKKRVINELHWDTLFPHTIFAFPDAGVTKNFYEPSDNYTIIDSSISVIESLYEFRYDVFNKIIGYNSSAKYAAKYAYDKNTKVRGAIILNPNINGINDVMNIPPSSIGYNYNACNNVRTFLVRDTNYNLYTEMFERKVAEGRGIIYSNRIADFDSKHPADSLMEKAIFFVEHPKFVEGDFGIYDIDIPKRICRVDDIYSLLIKCYRGSGYVSGPVVLINDKVIFNYSNLPKLRDFKTSYLRTQYINLYYEYDSTFSGKVKIKTYIGSSNDDNRLNDTMVKYIYYQPEPLESYFETGFEISDTLYDKYWYINPSEDTTSWIFNEEFFKKGKRSLSMHNNNLGYDNHSQSEEIFLPYIDMSSLSFQNLQFEYAFNYQVYDEKVKTDTLKVFASTNCDNTFELIYEKSGVELATVKSPTINPTKVSEAIYRPDESDWRTESIDLSKFSEEERVSIKIAIVSGNGGTIYLDNVRIGDFLNSVESKPRKGFIVSPNPATNFIRISDTSYKNETFYISDICGKVVQEIKNIEQLVDIEKLPSGIYFIQNNSDKPQKLIVH